MFLLEISSSFDFSLCIAPAKPVSLILRVSIRVLESRVSNPVVQSL
jgi:hypothetical protein